MKDNWFNKSIEDRIKWYKNNLSSLSNYLIIRSNFSSQEKRISKILLKGIKERVEEESKFAKAKKELGRFDAEEQKYYGLMSQSFNYLPDVNSEPTEWLMGVQKIQSKIVEKYH